MMALAPLLASDDVLLVPRSWRAVYHLIAPEPRGWLDEGGPQPDDIILRCMTRLPATACSCGRYRIVETDG